ncbi:hypothetical protein AD937_12385 [Gluconobacter japonicus]|nr:hypothetical protein AD937_12385 [Gluconobacter japonicus]
MKEIAVRTSGLMLIALLGLSGCAEPQRRDTRADLLRSVKSDRSGTDLSSAFQKDGKVHGSMSMSSGFGAGSGMGTGAGPSSLNGPGW